MTYGESLRRLWLSPSALTRLTVWLHFPVVRNTPANLSGHAHDVPPESSEAPRVAALQAALQIGTIAPCHPYGRSLLSWFCPPFCSGSLYLQF